MRSGKKKVLGSIELASGTTVNKLSTDDTLVGDSDNTLVTEKAIKAYVGNASSSTDVIKNSDNIMLNAFRIAINGSLTQFNMIDGIVDEYEDESGVDTGASTNESYDSGGDFYSPTVSSEIKVLLHFNGTDGSTTFTDDSLSVHSFQESGSSQLDDTQSKFGETSLYLDGSSSISAIDHDDFTLGNDDFCFEVWIYPIVSTRQAIVSVGDNTSNEWMWEISGTGNLRWIVYSGGFPMINISKSWTVVTDDWSHIAISRESNVYRMFVNGTQIGTDTTDSYTIPNYGGNMYIGVQADGSTIKFNGWLDDIRYTRGNAVYTSNFTEPIEEAGLYLNMSLISNSFTSEAAPSSARIIFLEEDINSIILNTDIIVKVSRDGGTNWSEVTLVDEGNYDASKKVLAATVDVSGQPSGVSMKYKIETANEKGLKIHGTGLSWS